MERLIKTSEKTIKGFNQGFKRYLIDQVDWDQRLILILGHRGVGKTTLLLQQMQKRQAKAIYLTLDDFHFESNRLVLVIEALYDLGYRSFYLDEVHRYIHWSVDLKNLYDNFPDVHFIVSGSSILEIQKGKGDLSRRAAVYHLAGLSFREYLMLENQIDLPPISLNEILANHQALSESITDQADITKLFKKYLEFGYYPFYLESENLYKSRLLETTQVVLEMDLSPWEDLTHKTIRNMKKLIFIISESVPFIPNISKLAEKLEVSRNTILKTLDLLEQAQILNLLRQSTRGVSFLQKPEKIYLQNTNLAFALSTYASNQGNLRETFFLNQVRQSHEVTLPKYGDFMVDDSYVFEIGGAGKTATQIQGIPNAYIVADDIKIGSGNKIPLWIFGFLY
ncbi:putative ATPase (AAA+ superfamily) [Belliella baltica DSM 15883]|uniref:Putative ATPase (AAA+ superfamily) n=1 Tax=Belliella baltica (strain DSM 15883 / CIP 108006 / LMG 21964 / BA134) TaxID=866536 RepID=I3Z9I1_BELBD|nr:AAA family ATPase [Belliella baltica]AFL85899.1 putative ATPase (AAA+ superfamily) [Belliella baltica DSM 15883]